VLVLGGDKCRQYLARLDATCIALASFDLKPTPLAEILYFLTFQMFAELA